MISLNKAMIIGNVTRDPELRYTANGQAVCNFSVATNRRYKNSQGDMQEDTEFHDVVAWGKLAEIITQILSKGSKVYVDGRLQTRQWEGADGNKRSKTEIVLDQFVPLTPKGTSTEIEIEEEKEIPEKNDGEQSGKETKKSDKKTNKTTKNKKSNNDSSDEEDIDLDDIPF